MPQITAIEPQKKIKDRLNLFINGQFAAGVNQLTALEHNLQVGKNLAQKDLANIILKEEITKLTDKVLRFLAIRPRSEKEVVDFLVGKIAKKQNVKFTEARNSLLIAPIIVKLKKYQYLSDRQFAKWWVSSRERSNPKGALVLKAELTKKGIAKDIIDSVLADLPNQVNTAKKLIQKKIKLWQKLSPFEYKRKIYQHLASRGFDYQTIRQTLAFLTKNR